MTGCWFIYIYIYIYIYIFNDFDHTSSSEGVCFFPECEHNTRRSKRVFFNFYFKGFIGHKYY